MRKGGEGGGKGEGGREASLVVENSRLLPKTFSKSSGEQRFS